MGMPQAAELKAAELGAMKAAQSTRKHAALTQARALDDELDTRKELLLRHVAPALAEAIRTGRCWGHVAHREPAQPLAAVAPAALAPAALAPAALAPPLAPPATALAVTRCAPSSARWWRTGGSGQVYSLAFRLVRH